MSTVNTRVIRNVANFVSTSSTNATVNVVSIMEVRLTDRTSVLRTGSDNDAAFRHFAGNYECDLELVLEDPVQANSLKGLSNQTVTFTGIDLTGNGNVNATVTSVSFKQAALPSAVYSDQARASIGGVGGQISFA